MKTIRPFGEQVLVLFKEAPEKTKGGIYIPDTAKEKPVEAVVVEVGPGRIEGGRRIEPSAKKGDVVLVEKWAQGVEVNVGGKKHNLVRESQILCAIDGEDETELKK